MLEHVSIFLSRLQHLKPRGPNQWRAQCPAHEDRHPSLDIRVADDDKLLVICRSGGCGIDDICAALGLDLPDLFPKRSESGRKLPWNPRQILESTALDATHVMLYGRSLLSGNMPSEAEQAALGAAVGRIHRGLELTQRG